jgi:hypothetical protein
MNAGLFSRLAERGLKVALMPYRRIFPDTLRAL